MTTKGKKEAKEVVLRGIGVSPGVVIGPVFLLTSEAAQITERDIQPDEADKEVGRLESALIETRRQIRRIQKDMESRTAPYDASVLDAHLMVLDDRSFIEEVVQEIRGKHKNVEAVVRTVADRYANVLASVDDDYLRERVVDVRDVARRIVRNLNGDVEISLSGLPQKHIVVAVDLAPSETAALRKDMVIGFVTDLGSPTSHTAVMARALEIPAIVGLHDVSERVSMGDEVLIDGNKGILIIHPSSEQLEKYGKVAEVRKNIERNLTTLQHQPAETLDGHRIVLSANAESLEEIPTILQHGAEGIGLFRSEYLYLSRDRAVTEEEQAEIYTAVASRLAPAPVIIRTLDIGGDKYLSEEQYQREANPFLGCRSIRLSLQYPDQFRMQLRAILRASAHGNVKLMYPMISNSGEVIRANELLEQAKQELTEAGVPFNKDLEVGVMIEIPGAALTADVIAEHVKFFSIGTNDLIQYTLAVDRVNERVAYLYEPTHPAVLNLIQHTIDAGHRHGIWVGICGEMGADPLMTPLLLGMGVDELSVAPLAVPLVKDVVRSMKYSRAKELTEVALSCKTAVEVLSHCRKFTIEVAPELQELI
jgi:phosphotransferase system enzyme I (PtsI)